LRLNRTLKKRGQKNEPERRFETKICGECG
jgi:hypothetical protein